MWLTDVTEFAGPDATVYLSAMIACGDGKVMAWQTSAHPDKIMTQAMLDHAIRDLPSGRALQLKDDPAQVPLIVHNDRGGHYRVPTWSETTTTAGITRSMSQKGCSPDNAACQGFFVRMKTEMFYAKTWKNTKQIEQAIHDYLDFYNNKRITTSINGLTINEHRHQTLGSKPSK